MKILCVEDGSIDTDAIEKEGLRDGKVLVYRQGATPPFILEIDDDFNYKKYWQQLKKEVNDGLDLMTDNGRHYFQQFLELMDLIEKGK